MNLKVQNIKFKMQNLLRAILFILFIVSCAPAQNDLQRIEDGGFVRNWLISNEFPAEIDAGAWENFNRFNVETLPQKDWLAPFGGVPKIKPSAGTFPATIQNQPPENPNRKFQIPNRRASAGSRRGFKRKGFAGRDGT
jgi:hypothetical protein